LAGAAAPVNQSWLWIHRSLPFKMSIDGKESKVVIG